MTIIVLLLQAVWFAFLARVIFSWFRPSETSPIRPVADFVHMVTEPVVTPIRRVLPRTGGLDFSVTIVLLVLTFVLIPIATSL
ncbi:MAG: YggT family protein [Candidatus Aldehydirespiratoraceae bacterium]